MRYYIISGEASGDLHGSNLIRSILKKDNNASIRAWGGDLMQNAGAEIVKHYRDLAFMGFVEVVKHLPTILQNISFCKKDILTFAPDVLVLIDYPGFNLRIAQWAKKQGIKVCYYISPQIWAWKESRVNIIKSSVDCMITILPFEKKFYKKHHYDVHYVGHPLTQVVNAALQCPIPEKLSVKPIIALLPGSRKQEINLKLPIMLQMVSLFPKYHFVVAQAPGQDEEIYKNIIGDLPVSLVKGKTYDLLRSAAFALVTSGTATLETALFGVPQIVCYKGNSLSYYVAKKLIKVKYISLVNLILDKPAVLELIQHDLNKDKLYQSLRELVENKDLQDRIHSDYARLWELLQIGGGADKAATLVVALGSHQK